MLAWCLRIRSVHRLGKLWTCNEEAVIGLLALAKRQIMANRTEICLENNRFNARLSFCRDRHAKILDFLLYQISFFFAIIVEQEINRHIHRLACVCLFRCAHTHTHTTTTLNHGFQVVCMHVRFFLFFCMPMCCIVPILTYIDANEGV